MRIRHVASPVAGRAVIAAVGLVLVCPVAPAAAAATAPLALHASPSGKEWVWPLDPVPDVIHVFDPPDVPWEAGNRGVDLLGSPAEPVRAIGAGVITFARPLAGRGVVVVNHGELRSTYEPVTASVQVGDLVDAGAVIGLLQTVQSHCAPLTCLHLGLRRGATYLDPLSLLGPRPVRLKPLESTNLSSAMEWLPTAGSSHTDAAGGGPAGRASAVAAGIRDAVGTVVVGLVEGPPG
jgi:Peptidase family M23